MRSMSSSSSVARLVTPDGRPSMSSSERLLMPENCGRNPRMPMPESTPAYWMTSTPAFFFSTSVRSAATVRSMSVASIDFDLLRRLGESCLHPAPGDDDVFRETASREHESQGRQRARWRHGDLLHGRDELRQFDGDGVRPWREAADAEQPLVIRCRRVEDASAGIGDGHASARQDGIRLIDDEAGQRRCHGTARLAGGAECDFRIWNSVAVRIVHATCQGCGVLGPGRVMHEREHDHEKERTKRTTGHESASASERGPSTTTGPDWEGGLKDRDSSAHLLSSQKVDRRTLG